MSKEKSGKGRRGKPPPRICWIIPPAAYAESAWRSVLTMRLPFLRISTRRVTQEKISTTIWSGNLKRGRRHHERRRDRIPVHYPGNDVRRGEGYFVRFHRLCPGGIGHRHVRRSGAVHLFEQSLPCHDADPDLCG